jgi:hypothetical protein
MGEVVYVNFQSKGKKDHNKLEGCKFSEFIADLVRVGIDSEDILEIIDAINDSTVYDLADEEIQFIVDMWENNYK